MTEGVNAEMITMLRCSGKPSGVYLAFEKDQQQFHQPTTYDLNIEKEPFGLIWPRDQVPIDH